MKFLPNSLIIEVFVYHLICVAAETSGGVYEVSEASLTAQAEGA